VSNGGQCVPVSTSSGGGGAPTCGAGYVSSNGGCVPVSTSH
jgi:hypothetical protein